MYDVCSSAQFSILKNQGKRHDSMKLRWMISLLMVPLWQAIHLLFIDLLFSNNYYLQQKETITQLKFTH